MLSTTARNGKWDKYTKPPKMSQKAQAALAYQDVSGVPIKLMTLSLLALTVGFAYDLWQKRRLPHQNGGLELAAEFIKKKDMRSQRK